MKVRLLSLEFQDDKQSFNSSFLTILKHEQQQTKKNVFNLSKPVLHNKKSDQVIKLFSKGISKYVMRQCFQSINKPENFPLIEEICD